MGWAYLGTSESICTEILKKRFSEKLIYTDYLSLLSRILSEKTSKAKLVSLLLNKKIPEEVYEVAVELEDDPFFQYIKSTGFVVMHSGISFRTTYGGFVEFFKTKYERFKTISAKILLEDLVALCPNFEKKASSRYILKRSEDQLYAYEFAPCFPQKLIIVLWKGDGDNKSLQQLGHIPVHWIFATEAQLEKILLTENCLEIYDAIKDIQSIIDSGVLKMIRTYYTNPDLMSDRDFTKMDNLS